MAGFVRCLQTSEPIRFRTRLLMESAMMDENVLASMDDNCPSRRSIFPDGGSSPLLSSLSSLRQSGGPKQYWRAHMLAVFFVVAAILNLCPPANGDDSLDNYNSAISLYERMRWKDAAEQFREFVKDNDKHEKAPLARLYLGLTLVNLTDYAGAREELRKFASEHKQNSNINKARYRIGECSYLLDDLESAQKELTSFLSDFPQDSLCEHALPYLGDVQLRLKDPATALKLFEQSIELFPTGRLIEDAKFGRARALQELKQDDKAIEQFQELAARKQSDRAADAQFHLGASYFDRKQFPAAIKAYTALANDFPNSKLVPPAQLNLGYALYQSRQFAEAARQFELAAKEDSQQSNALYWQGRSLKAGGDYSRAVEVLKSAAKRAGEEPPADAILFEQGLCERYLQHAAESRQLLKQVLLRFPDSDFADDSLHALTEMSIESGDLTSAEEFLANFQKDFPKSGLRLHFELLAGRLDLAKAGASLREDRAPTDLSQLYDSAAKRFDRVMNESTIPKTKGQARYYQALARQLQGNHAQAEELIAPLVQQTLADGAKSDFADPLVLQADSLYQLQKYEAARVIMAKYQELFPTGRQLPRALSIQALAADNLNDPTGSTAALDRLMKDFPKHSLTASTVQQLAELADARKDWTTAERLYRSLANLQQDPDKKAYALRGIALAQYEQEQFAEAAVSFGRIENEIPNHSLVLECAYYRADSLKKAKQNDRALTLFQNLFQSTPKNQPFARKAELEPPL